MTACSLGVLCDMSGAVILLRADEGAEDCTDCTLAIDLGEESSDSYWDVVLNTMCDALAAGALA